MENQFETVLTANPNTFRETCRQVKAYRDLILLFVRRDFVLTYKQTVLGPIWLLIKPFMTSVVFAFIFGGIAGISTDGTPQLLFYMAGNMLWACFSTTLTGASNTFITNSAIFSKVYFPRLTMPVAQMLISIINFFIQCAMYLIMIVYYKLTGADIMFTKYAFLIPVVLVQVSVLGLSIGIMVSSLTTKYRDLSIVVTFALQLWMYLTPIVYPLSMTSGVMRACLLVNPMTMPVEIMRLGTLGQGTFNLPSFLGAIAFSVLFFAAGIRMFTKVERNFVDTI